MQAIGEYREYTRSDLDLSPRSKEYQEWFLEHCHVAQSLRWGCSFASICTVIAWASEQHCRRGESEVTAGNLHDLLDQEAMVVEYMSGVFQIGVGVSLWECGMIATAVLNENGIDVRVRVVQSGSEGFADSFLSDVQLQSERMDSPSPCMVVPNFLRVVGSKRYGHFSPIAMVHPCENVDSTSIFVSETNERRMKPHWIDIKAVVRGMDTAVKKKSPSPPCDRGRRGYLLCTLGALALSFGGERRENGAQPSAGSLGNGLQFVSRVARMEEALLLARMQVRAWKKHYVGIIDEAYLQSVTVLKKLKRWYENLEDEKKTTFIVYHGESRRPIGYTTVGEPGKGTLRHIVPKVTQAHDRITVVEIYTFYLDTWTPKRRGFGSELMRVALQHATQQSRGNDEHLLLCLWALGENAGAIAFYERHGFEVVVNDRRAVFGGKRYPYTGMCKKVAIGLS